MTNAKIQIRKATQQEAPEWGQMRTALWPDCSAAENEAEARAYFAGGDLKLVLIAWAGQDAIGFAEISERNIVDGCDGGPSAFLEGWYVQARFRGQGVGRALIDTAANWAGEQGYPWLGSDTELENKNGQSAHKALGFEETGRVVTFRRRVGK